MFEIKKSLPVTVLFAASVMLGACSSYGESTEGTGDTKDEAAQPPALPVFSGEGVTVETNTPDHASGRFERHNAAIHFDISKTQEVRHVVITRVSGEALFESTLDHGIDTSSYLGGKMKTVGPMGEEPQKEGNPAAFDELSVMPEAKVMIELKPALGGAGVSEDLLRVVDPSATKTTTPKVYGAGGNSPYPDGVWRVLGTGQSVGFYSWGFWATTAIVLQGADNYHSARLRVGANFATEYVSGYGEVRYYRQWWGQYADVTNLRVSMCYPPNWIYCQNATLWIMVK